jgi:hypothetical protein
MFKIIILSIFVGMTLAAVTTAEICKNDQNSGNYLLFQ